ncbi:hypothetical protein D3C73_1483630 [compost metagenome]
MEVGNNGQRPEENPLLKLRGKGGMGLQGMAERVHLVGGTLELQLKPEFAVITRIALHNQPDKLPL